MKKTHIFYMLVLMSVHLYAQQKNKLQQDRDAIKSLAGCYKVTFEFAETFAPDTSYQYHPRKFDWGIEYVFIIEDTDRKISLQHLLIVNDTTIVKHWRQDWVYENTELLSYYKDNEWKKIKLPADKAKGTWTQKVYQVDDSPRYEGYGTWLHVDGRHFWESVCDAPLPRREILKRNDYNVLRRHSRIELTPYGWILEQDNEKIIRSQEGDKLLCWEKGFEKFLRGDYNCQPAIKWWEKNKLYWADVRKVWNEIITQNNVVKIEKKIDNKFLFEQLFKIGDEFTKYTPYNSTEAAAAIRKSIDMYITKK